MSTPIYAYTEKHSITQDRAGHLVVERVNSDGYMVGAIDFGTATIGPVPVLLTWLELDDPMRSELAPAIDALLTAEFEKHKV